MAPSQIIDDYYKVLEVEQNATPEMIVQSYKRLALKVYPDKNAKDQKPDSTEAFKLLLNAYETLKDEGKRREYDFIYPFITQIQSYPVLNPEEEARRDKAELAALQKSIQERFARWEAAKVEYESSIAKLQEDISRLEQKLEGLGRTAASETGEEGAQDDDNRRLETGVDKNRAGNHERIAGFGDSMGLSIPGYRKDLAGIGESVAQIQKDMKSFRMEWAKAQLKMEQGLFEVAEQMEEGAHRSCVLSSKGLERRIKARESREKHAREGM